MRLMVTYGTPLAEQHWTVFATSPKLLAQARRIISLSWSPKSHEAARPDQSSMVMQNPEQKIVS